MMVSFWSHNFGVVSLIPSGPLDIVKWKMCLQAMSIYIVGRSLLAIEQREKNIIVSTSKLGKNTLENSTSSKM